MTTIKNDAEYRTLKENEKKEYILVESKIGNQLIIPNNIFKRGFARQEEEEIRNPELIYIDDDLLVLTIKEWGKIQRATAKHDFCEIYHWEKKNRFKGIYSSQTKSGIRQVLNKRNR